LSAEFAVLLKSLNLTVSLFINETHDSVVIQAGTFHGLASVNLFVSAQAASGLNNGTCNGEVNLIGLTFSVVLVNLGTVYQFDQVVWMYL